MHQNSCVFLSFIPFALKREHTHWTGSMWEKHTLEDQMDLMNTHLLTSWVWGTHTLGDQMDFGEIHMTTSWIWGTHTTLTPSSSNPPSLEDGSKQKQT